MKCYRWKTSSKIVERNVGLDASNDIDKDLRISGCETGCLRKMLMGIFCQIMREWLVNLELRYDSVLMQEYTPVGIYMFKVNNRNFRARCEICSKLTKKTLERRQLWAGKCRLARVRENPLSYFTQWPCLDVFQIMHVTKNCDTDRWTFFIEHSLSMNITPVKWMETYI